ncbi:hypothetical protein GCM10007304_03960 [Rhodococcoides trifolii]|uniref:PAS domain S-box protein n=1 Tax=Rhodococcoides trifolii TaxID=908250 RepID=A0A917CM93_9NOCA|nr:EAL domain-containing protein [Rhodococcus trifolii]GGF93304.1 hypothetical protein GCM10007304_03960 [Rhodococcus trifolii]
MTAPTVVAIGSSAGGIEALSKLFGTVDVNTDWCFVVAQHLSPEEPSQLADILGRKTTLRVVEAEDGDSLEPGTVLLGPPGLDLLVRADHVDVVAPSDERRPWPSVDHLLISAAEAFGSRSVAVVLSGTGDDGAAGVEAIEAAGGIVAIQDPESTPYDAMPRAAFATGAVDLVLPVGQIVPRLAQLLRIETPIADAFDSFGMSTADETLVDDVNAVLLATTGMDFSGYKRSTVRRQIGRRQRTVDAPSLKEYVDRLHAEPDEVTALARVLLVTVTAFFRDSDVWNGLTKHLDALVAELDGGTLRLWVAGCASGEEAYTLAMLAAEALGDVREDMSERVKIFATDLDDRALNVARRGRYSTASVEAVPERLRTRWMRQIGDEWEVVPALRESIVFARHNIAFDPPFPHIHMMSLRNTLIYFQSHLQERVLHICQFALEPNGLLLLGQSERVPRADALFTVVEHELRLYRRRVSSRSSALPMARFSSIPRVAPEPSRVETQAARPSVGMYRKLLRTLASPTLVVDEHGGLVEVIGDVSLWCSVAEGPHSGHVGELLREPYRLAIRAMLSQLRFSDPGEIVRDVGNGPEAVTVTATRMVGDGLSALVSFALPADGAERVFITTAGGDSDVLRVSAELESTQEALQATVEDLTASNEELQAMNEELQASSEELQASSEEVQASYEELEATNEELTTLNQELQVRSTELAQANNDLENIQTSLTNGLVLVDRDLRVTRYTPLAVRLFSLIPEDIGRPLPAVPTTIEVPDLDRSLRETIASNKSAIIELSSDTRDLLVQTQPYVGTGSETVGAIVVVIDVSEMAAERRRRERAMANLQVVTESVRELVWQRSVSGELTLLTSRVEGLYGLDRERVLAEPSLLLDAVHPDDRARVATATASASRQWEIAYRIIRPDGSERWIEESVSFVENPADADDSFYIGSALDVTDRHMIEQVAGENSAVLTGLFDTEVFGVLVLDDDDRILRANDRFAEMVGYRPSALVGTPMPVLLEPEPTARSAGDFPFEARSDADVGSRRLTRSDGIARQVSVEFLAVGKGDTTFGPRRIAVVHDVSRMREISAELAMHEQFDQQTGLLTRSYFRARTEEAVSENAGGVAILWVDLDGFKEVNDRLGHRSGDVVLATVARRLQTVARRHDVIGRLGGDEFAILVTRMQDLDNVDSLALRMLAAVREPVALGETLAFVSASIGIALYPQDGTTAEELLHNADTAMYSAKQHGRDRHAYFTPEMNSVADERAAMRHDIAEAVRHHDFVMYYQPVYDVATGDIAMVEALVRWQRDDEIVSADRFIDIAAETGQLRALGQLILRAVDRDMNAMADALKDKQPRVAVNLSGTELQERETVDWLLAWRPAGGFEKLLIEVTESVLLAPGGRARDSLSVLRRLGATISVDDFGIGYSNLELLDSLEPGVIKIDRSLLERAGEDARGAQILTAAVQLAHALDASVVIEGVADESLMTHVRGLGAELAQGYHLAEPMPLESLIDLIKLSS